MMDIDESQSELGFRFPGRHREAIFDSKDPIHDRCDFLIPSSPYKLLRIVTVNEFLHSSTNPNPWPPYLVAFASNGCGDYFAYDLRTEPFRIVYMDPDYTIEENLNAPDRLEFSSFEEWYANRMA
jgi:hypothetical protein